METRKDEKRYKTSDPKKMLNMFLAARVLKTWKEDFVDEDTGEKVSIERNEILYDAGTAIDQDTLARIRFDMEAGDIQEVEVSNQRRMARENHANQLALFTVTASIGNKPVKFLLYARSCQNAMEIIADYIELNYSGFFHITQVKLYNQYIVLMDNLALPSTEEPGEEPDTPPEDEETKIKLKYYAIDCRIMYDGESTESSFLVYTTDTDKAMILINDYLLRQRDENKAAVEARGGTYESKSIHPTIEKVVPVPVGCFVPKEFSEVYSTDYDKE